MKTRKFDFSVDLMQAILWQYDGAEKIQALLQKKQEWYNKNHTQFWNNWTRDVFDLRTANEFGLSVWAIILGVPLALGIPVPERKVRPFGFSKTSANFDNGPFAERSSFNSSVRLSLEGKRLLLRLRYFQLISRGTLPEINNFLKMLFKDQGKAFVLDPGDMEFIVYVFMFQPNPDLILILENYDVFPRPAGVGVKYRISIGKYFGFSKTSANFDNGPFADF